MPGEPRQDSSWQRVSLVTAASVTKYSGAAQELAGRVNPEKRTWERRGMELLVGAAAMVGVKLVEKFIDEAFERRKKGWKPEASKPQESWMKEDFKELIQQVKAMREDLQKGQESKKGWEPEASKPQESWMKEDFKELIQQVKAMREDLQKGQESKKGWEPEASKPQESWMKEDFQKLTREMKALREDLQKGQEYTNWLFQLLIEGLNQELGEQGHSQALPSLSTPKLLYRQTTLRAHPAQLLKGAGEGRP
ncbi:uncharacterized protein LOC135406082 [Pseudopipra pipra]|uniref:uncharacterized protein LOC135406082 n=1 Tax=Pseudopipra pipra TaxID=415032 RepID=UPI00313A2FEA